MGALSELALVEQTGELGEGSMALVAIRPALRLARFAALVRSVQGCADASRLSVAADTRLIAFREARHDYGWGTAKSGVWQATFGRRERIFSLRRQIIGDQARAAFVGQVAPGPLQGH